MPARLIVNADDFGLTRGINRAVAELNSAGVLTSATLMANGPAFDDAVGIANSHPTLGVGCHIVLTDGIPVSPPDQIPTLLSPDRKSFRPSLVGFLSALLRNQVREEEIKLEARAQIEKLQRAGILITHVDTHKHTHLFATVSRPLMAACEAASIPAIRNPFEPAFSLALNHGSVTRRIAIKMLARLRPGFESQLSAHHIATTDGTIAISATGQLNPFTLGEILAALPPTGTYELCCHPGYNDPDLALVSTRLRAHRDIEREALLAEIPHRQSQPNPPQLVSYANLCAPK